jgi:predicted RNA-binding Zn ribbon-like protein
VASIVVNGLVIPIALAGHPVLDFCNTRAAWLAPVPKEYLVSHAHLTLWAAENDVVPARVVPAMRRAAKRAPGRAAAIVHRAVRFRGALYSVLVGPATPGDWAAINIEVRRAGRALTLKRGRPATWQVASTGLELPLLAIAWAAGEFLTTPGAATVAACPSADCGWLFSNPRGRRRWCSMALCGNRAKVRRHAERTRGTAPPPAAGPA